MWKFAPLLILFFSAALWAQPVRLSAPRLGKVRISSGGKSSLLDLRREISGCLLTYDGTDPRSGKTDTTNFELLDTTRKNGFLYLVLFASAGGNCNIQGECGATDDWTLIWLKLSTSLRILQKKAEVVQSCRYASFEVEAELTEQSGNPFRLVNGELQIEYSENKYRESQEYRFHTLTYQKETPEKGFMVVTEKRQRPQ